jgi:hypothetical protein
MCNRKCEKSPTTITIGLYLAALAQFDRADTSGQMQPQPNISIQELSCRASAPVNGRQGTFLASGKGSV